jgi:2-polyprenyl-3-methyl-5-hydroxy-6-metoxy-1,4-benzoquinol methylase
MSAEVDIEAARRHFEPNWASEGDHVVLNDAARIAADHYNVVATIHRRDFIFLTGYTHFKGDVGAAAAAYYLSGRATAENLRNVLACIGYDYSFARTNTKPFSLLDFAAGYGCATRHFRNVMPTATVHSIDIHPEAVSFNADELGCPSSISTSDPADLQPVDTFDVVLALSFLSHVPKHRFSGWLRSLLAHTKAGGYLIFTTAGEASRQISMSNLQVDDDGFGAIRDSEQYDLSLDDYQHVVALPRFVLAKIEEMPEAELRVFLHAFWWQHQDTYVIKRLP